MKINKTLVLTALILIAAVAVVLGGAGSGVGQDGYVIGDATVTPSAGACIGGTVTVSGSGATPNTAVTVTAETGTSNSGVYVVSLGSTTSDAAGNWSLKTTMPTTALLEASGIPGAPVGSHVATPSGTWRVFALNEASSYTGEFTAVYCATSLPSTGFPVAGALLGAGLLASSGAGFRAWTRRRR